MVGHQFRAFLRARHAVLLATAPLLLATPAFAAPAAESLAVTAAAGESAPDTEIIVVGGGLSLVGEPLRGAIAAALPAYLMDAFHPGPRVALAGLGEDSVPVGALALAAAIVAA